MNKPVSQIMWQYCDSLNEVNRAILNGDPDWEGLRSADDIINIMHDPYTRNYVVIWKVRPNED